MQTTGLDVRRAKEPGIVIAIASDLQAVSTGTVTSPVDIVQAEEYVVTYVGPEVDGIGAAITEHPGTITIRE